MVRCRAIGVVRLEQDRKGGGGRIRNDRLILLPVKYERGAPIASKDAEGSATDAARTRSSECHPTANNTVTNTSPKSRRIWRKVRR